MYTDAERMLGFARAALASIPGVSECRFLPEGGPDADAPVDAETPGEDCYTVDMRTTGGHYGSVHLDIDDRQLFEQYETAVHNFATTIALRLENLERRRSLEDQVREQTASIEAALKERELLLREIHHRVKNNLNMAVSLLKLQFGGFEDDAVQRALAASIDRIQSMSLVHQFLYQSSTLGEIDLVGFVGHLVEQLSQTYVIGTKVQITTNIAPITIDIAIALPVSLMINELITNAVKYAFPGDRAGTIAISATHGSTDRIVLEVSDDGVGLPYGFDIEQATSLGMQLITALSQQLHANLRISGPPGTTFQIVFPNPRA